MSIKLEYIKTNGLFSAGDTLEIREITPHVERMIELGEIRVLDNKPDEGILCELTGKCGITNIPEHIAVFTKGDRFRIQSLSQFWRNEISKGNMLVVSEISLKRKEKVEEEEKINRSK